MRDFIEDGYIWVLQRTAEDYVLAKDNTGLSAFDVPKDWQDCPYSFDEVEQYWILHPEKHFEIKEPEPTEEEKLKQELSLLLEWFEIYDEKVMQYLRSQRLCVAWDDDITAWDEQAGIKAERIKEIRGILDNL